jgi:hypothetical protein
MKKISTVTHKVLLGVGVVVATMVAAACAGVEVHCKVKPASEGLPELTGASAGLMATEFPALAAGTSVSADQQGYEALTVVVAEIPVPNIARSIQQGMSSNSVFLRATISNAVLMTKRGTSVLSMSKSDGTSVGSATFPYHVSGNRLLFDDPALVDQWVVSYIALANYLTVGIPDLVLDTGTTSKQVTVDAEVAYADVEVVSDRRSWYSAKKNCVRCLIP